MNKEVYGGIFGTIMSATGTSMQTNDVLQTISLILTICGSIITLAMAIVNWCKNAKKDGKITTDEIKDGLDMIQDETSKIKEDISNVKNKRNNK